MTWRIARRDDRQIAALWAVCAAACLALRPLWLAAAGLFPPCLWHAWTGLPCPGCGATRAVLALLRGQLGAAFGFNPLAAAGAAVFVAVGLVAPVWVAAGGRVPVVAPKPLWSAAAAAAVAANWAWLVVSGV